MAATQDAMYRSAREAHEKFNNTKNAYKYRHNWINVIRKYEHVVKNYPSGPPTEASYLAIGDLYLGLYRYSRKSSDLEGALGGYRYLTQKYSKSESAARAQLKIGDIYFKYKKDLDKAYVELLKVELNHPNCRDEVEAARRIMAEISGSSGLDVSELIKKPPPKPERLDISPSKAVETPAAPAVIEGIRYWPDKNYSRLAIDLTHQVKFKEHLLPQDDRLGKPMRIYLDLSPATISANIREEHPIRDVILKRARVGQYDQETVRLVLDIEHIQSYRVFSLNDPFRIVVDVMGDKSPEGIRQKVIAKIQEKNSQLSTASGVNRQQPSKPLEDLRKTAFKEEKDSPGTGPDQIQPGLPGPSVGTGNPAGGDRSRARRKRPRRHRRHRLEGKRTGIESIKTPGHQNKKTTGHGSPFDPERRTNSLPLEERTAFANTKGADLFISVHANAHKSEKVHGLETYFLNLATDDDAMMVAARENATTRKNMSDLQMILSDLMLNSKITESGRLGSKVHKSIVAHIEKKYKIRDLGVKQAPFYVLIGANMPSILVEIGFLSNRVEEKRLKSKGLYQSHHGRHYRRHQKIQCLNQRESVEGEATCRSRGDVTRYIPSFIYPYILNNRPNHLPVSVTGGL